MANGLRIDLKRIMELKYRGNNRAGHGGFGRALRNLSYFALLGALAFTSLQCSGNKQADQPKAPAKNASGETKPPPAQLAENMEEQKPGAQTQKIEEVPVTGPGAAANIAAPLHKSSAEFVQYMSKNRGEDPRYLQQRYEREQALISNKDLYREKEIKAFLMTPREKFCRPKNLSRAYDHAYLDIGYGVTISGPYVVGRMTSAIDLQPGEKVLEIGTGSGYQSAVLSYLTDHVYTIEIIEPLETETNKIYDELSKKGYPEYAKIKRKADDGYYGWEQYAPFDKIIVTCGIDHIPPPLLKQLKDDGGIMVIPVGPPGAQVLLKVTKKKDANGEISISREDIYQGRLKVPFVPFTKKDGGTHYQK